MKYKLIIDKNAEESNLVFAAVQHGRQLPCRTAGIMFQKL